MVVALYFVLAFVFGSLGELSVAHLMVSILGHLPVCFHVCVYRHVVLHFVAIDYHRFSHIVGSAMFVFAYQI